MAQASPVASSIFKALESASSCSNETLLGIRSILLQDGSEKNELQGKEDVRGGLCHARAKSLVSTTRVTTKATARTTAHARQFTVVEVKQDAKLGEQEKVSFAFQVVNSCIKLLSQLAKEHVASKTALSPPGDDGPKPTKGKPKPSAIVLRPKSPNVRRFKNMDEVCKTSNSTSSPPAIVAACAIAALAHLRNHYTVSSKKDTNLQVENGALAVIAKCIDLELVDPAIEQLHLLKNRVLEHLGQNHDRISLRPQNATTFAKLIEFPSEISRSSYLQIAVKIQQHIWQVACLIANADIVHTLASSQNVQCELLYLHAKQMADPARANRSLLAMAKLFLQLSMLPDLSAEALLYLRCSAFSHQIRASTIRLEQVDAEVKSICARLVRCLEAYSNTSKAAHDARLKTVNEAVQPIINEVQGLQSSDEVVGLLRTALKRLDVNNALIQIKSRDGTPVEAMRHAAGSLCAGRSGDLKLALQVLQQRLPDLKATADCLLVEVVSMRRALHKAVSERKVPGEDASPVATACVSFLSRYLGLGYETSRVLDDAEDRLALAAKFVKPFISTVVVCCMNTVALSSDMLASLQLCCNVFQCLCNIDSTFADQRFNESRQPETSIFITISKLCHRTWNLRMKDHGARDELGLQALKTSIDVMEAWSIEEKKAADMTQRLRYLMDAYITRSEHGNAHSVFVRILHEFAAADSLDDLGKQAAHSSISTTHEKGTIGGTLYSCHRSMIPSMLKLDLTEHDVSFAEIAMNAAARGLLLEWQLDHLASYTTQQRIVSASCERLIELTSKALLQAYTKQQYPIRRLRAGLAIAHLLPACPQLAEAQVLLEDVKLPEKVKTFGEDADLGRHITFLRTSLHATIALLNPFGDDTPMILTECTENYNDLSIQMKCTKDVLEAIDDINAWSQDLEALADFYALRRDTRQEVKVLEMALQVLMRVTDSKEKRMRLLCRLANAYTSIGHMGDAHKVLDTAKLDLAGQSTSQSHINWLLAQAFYHLTMSEYDSCSDLLRKASFIAYEGGEQNFVTSTFASTSTTLNSDSRRLIAQAAYLNGLLNLHTGKPAHALRFCTIAKCMLFKTWTSMEQLMPRDVPIPAPPQLNVCPSSNDSSSIEDFQPVAVSRSYSHLSAPQLRMLVPDLLHVAMLENQIHDHRGAYHQAFAALKHANKIANYIGGGVAGLCDMSAAGLYLRSLPLSSLSIRESKVEEARQRLEMVDEKFLSSTMNMDALKYGKIKAALLGAEDEPQEQLEILETTMKKLRSMLREAGNIKCTVLRSKLANSVNDLATMISTMNLEQDNKSSKAAKLAGKATAVKVKKSTSKIKVPEEAVNDIDTNLKTVPLESWHANLLLATSLTALRYHANPDFEMIAQFLNNAEALLCKANDAAEHGLAYATFLLHQTKCQMESDITYNALSDCIVSLPAPQSKERQKETFQATKVPRKARTLKSAAKPATDRPASEPRPQFVALLQEAYSNMRSNLTSSDSKLPTKLLRQFGCMLSDISMISSPFSLGLLPEVSHPLNLAWHNELPAIQAYCTSRATEHPAVEKLSKEDLRVWPSVDQDPWSQARAEALDRSTFQQNFIDILPASWNVVSISLSEDKSAMNMIRYRSDQSPFALRVPFAHREADDPDEEVLDMALAYARLQSIVQQHEFTATEAGITDQAEFKKQWWQKKYDLDTELRMLLFDVEEQWFSGVKGIFASQKADPQALSNFQARLQTILSQHCPAKAAKGKGKAPLQGLKLEPRILELFVGLGNPSDEVEVDGESGSVSVSLAESQRMSDGIHELVRLVLEGLQFAGESVAIDEVDMDSVIVKVVDALRDYYETLDYDYNSSRHTILILDNQLHGFPWESLPCMRGRSVSRLPSLADLRERIMAAKISLADDSPAGKVISRTSGISLVNPSGDLKKTAQRFQPWLKKLPPNWVHVCNSPDEQGWTELLSENELFLYVGHGSTSQYVRPHAVKRLGYNDPNEDTGLTCAVSWLVGCSSVAVEDLGEFEPSGMILSYLAAGSPAVLGALWDVGDIDADQFSITAGDYWGLWDESNKGLDPKLFPARKKIIEEKKALNRQMSMTEAVARSRGGCKLPYLNGAAFVVYGIPVFLD